MTGSGHIKGILKPQELDVQERHSEYGGTASAHQSQHATGSHYGAHSQYQSADAISHIPQYNSGQQFYQPSGPAYNTFMGPEQHYPMTNMNYQIQQQLPPNFGHTGPYTKYLKAGGPSSNLPPVPKFTNRFDRFSNPN